MNAIPHPIGLVLSQTAKVTTRYFDACLVSAGGTLPIWLILQALQAQKGVMQSDLALAIGVQGPTLTHHLNGMEGQDLITRARTPADRRNHLVTVTPAGQARFDQLRQSAIDFDKSLRGAISKTEMKQLRKLLAKIGAAATAHVAG